MSAVIESIDTGADLNANTTDSGSGEAIESSPGTSQSADSQPTGDSASTAGATDTGTAPIGAGADAQPAAGSEAKDKLVPLSALHEARNELRALRTKIAELEAKPSLTPQQQAQLDKLNAQETAATNKVPDFLEDPKGYVDSALKQTREEVKTVREENQKLTQSQQQQQALNQILSGVAHHEAAFVKATPDYHQAVEHTRTVRTSQLQMLYPQATAEQIQQQIAREEIGAAAQVMQAGGNPADFVYRYAKTLGYAPKVAAPNTNGATPPDKDAIRTLGNGGGADKDEAAADDELGSAMKAALAERFGVRKKR